MMRKINKIFPTLLLALLACCATQVWGQDIEAGGIYYDIISDDEVAVVPAWDSGVSLYDGVIILPEQVYCDGVNYAVTTIADSAFWLSSVTLVQVPNSVKYIGEAAFAYAEQLTSITLPLGLTYVSKNMLAGTAIANIVLPEGVTAIGYGAFQSCGQLHTVFLPSTLTSIGAYAFNNCHNLFEMYCAASTPPDASSWATFIGLSGIDVILPDATAARLYQDDAVWGDSETFSLWVDEGLTFSTTLRSETYMDDWVSVELGDNMAYKIYDPDGYLVALTAADRYYLPIDDHAVEYLIVPTDLIYDDEDDELALTVMPAAIEELDTDPVPHPVITAACGTIYISGDNYGKWLYIYDMYGRLWYQRPSVTNCLGIDGLPRNRVYIVRVGDYVRKVLLN